MRFSLNFVSTVMSVLLVIALTCCPVEAYIMSYDSKPQQSAMLTRLYYQIGLQLASQGKLHLSTNIMEQIYRLNPGNLDLALNYIAFLQAQGDYEKTIAVCNDLLNKFSEPTTEATIYYTMSITYDYMHQTDKAIELMEKAIRTNSENSSAIYFYDLGVLYSKLNRFNQTQHYSQKAVELAPSFAEAWNNLGFSLAKLGQYQDGYNAIEESLKINPQNPNTLDSKGYVLFHMGRFKESVLEYEKAIKLNPLMAESFLYMGKSYEALESLDKAVDAFEKFLELSENQPDQDNMELKEKIHQLKTINALKKIISLPETDEQSKPVLEQNTPSFR